MNGLFITFEGPDGSGKTTQIKKTADKVKALGKDVVLTREPGGTALGEAVRKILLDPQQTNLADSAEVLLYAAARAQHVCQVIKPALAQGKLVLCDRFVDSSIAYQGYGRGLDLEFITSINNQATGGVVPRLTILLDLPVEQGLIRAKGVGEPDRLEGEALSFHEKVRQGYLRLCQQESNRFRLINADRGPESVFEDVWSVVCETLGGNIDEVDGNGKSE